MRLSPPPAWRQLNGFSLDGAFPIRQPAGNRLPDILEPGTIQIQLNVSNNMQRSIFSVVSPHSPLQVSRS
jgi:hypothetical protein